MNVMVLIGYRYKEEFIVGVYKTLDDGITNVLR